MSSFVTSLRIYILTHLRLNTLMSSRICIITYLRHYAFTFTRTNITVIATEILATASLQNSGFSQWPQTAATRTPSIALNYPTLISAQFENPSGLGASAVDLLPQLSCSFIRLLSGFNRPPPTFDHTTSLSLATAHLTRTISLMKTA